MNEQFDEQILESLLEEMLTGRHPPDLTESILNAWLLEREKRSRRATDAGKPASRKSLIVAKLAEHPQNEQPDTRDVVDQAEKRRQAEPAASTAGKVNGRAMVVAELVGSSSQAAASVDASTKVLLPARRRRYGRRSFARRYLATVLTVTASVIFVAVACRIFFDSTGTTLVEKPAGANPAVELADGKQAPEIREIETDTLLAQESAEPSVTSDKDSADPSAADSLALAKLPLADPRNSSASGGRSPQRPAARQSAARHSPARREMSKQFLAI